MHIAITSCQVLILWMSEPVATWQHCSSRSLKPTTNRLRALSSTSDPCWWWQYSHYKLLSNNMLSDIHENVIFWYWLLSEAENPAFTLSKYPRVVMSLVFNNATLLTSEIIKWLKLVFSAEEWNIQRIILTFSVEYIELWATWKRNRTKDKLVTSR